MCISVGLLKRDGVLWQPVLGTERLKGEGVDEGAGGSSRLIRYPQPTRRADKGVNSSVV